MIQAIAVAIAVAIAAGPAQERETPEAVEEQVDAVTVIAVGGGFAALAVVGAIGAVAGGAAALFGVAASGAAETNPALLAIALVPLAIGGLAALANGAIGIGLVTWGRGKLERALMVARPAPRTPVRRRDTTFDAERDEPEDENRLWPREKRRVAD